jgi:hypothetical protein
MELIRFWGKKAFVLLFIMALGWAQPVYAQSKFVNWVQNPLGFYPVELQGGTGFYWGVAAIGTTFLLGEMFSKKDTLTRYRLSVYNEVGVSLGYANRKGITVGINNIGVQYRVLRWMGVGAELTTYMYHGPLNNTVGFGARPFARWYIVHKNSWDLFFEYGAGVIWNLDEFPITTDPGPARVGTHFNFTPKYSLGADVWLNNRVYVSFGIRHVHVSNAYLFGSDRNPAFDSNGVFLAIKFDSKLPLLDVLFNNSRMAVNTGRRQKAGRAVKNKGGQ